MKKWSRLAFVPVSGLFLLPLAAVASAAHVMPNVLYGVVSAASLPQNPAYTRAALVRDLAVLNHSTKRRTVNVLIDSEARIAALKQYSQAVSNPKSPLFHHFLTPNELDSRFGPTPAMIERARASMNAAGWRVGTIKGLVASVSVPAARSNPGLPVSPDIWSISGFAPHGIIRTPMRAHIVHSATPTQPLRHAVPAGASVPVPNLSLTGENFHAMPVVLKQTTEANGDVVSVMSWNPMVSSTVPAGLPINLFVTVEDPQGNFLPISNIGGLNDADQALVSYGTNAMPHSSNTLWQMPIAAWKDIPAGDTLTLQVTLANNTTLNASFPLPAFTGPATALSPLTGQQMNSVSGMTNLPSSPGAIALFAIGTTPSLKDVTSYLQQNTTKTPSPTVHFLYEDGATANEYGQTGDSQESELDLQAAAGAAPGATIQDYVFPENDQNDPLISYLTDLSQQSTAKIASLSYGFFGEDPATLNTLMDALTAEGITVLEASGDQGAWDNGSDPGPVGLSALEQVPSVLTLGGTDIAAPATTDASGATVNMTGPLIAKVWGGDYLNGIPVAIAQAYTNQNAASSGGYASAPIPVWQQSFLPSGATGLGVPDIASVAGNPGLSGFLQGQNVVFGGTSLAAPLTAGWLADVESILGLSTTGMGNINPLLFQAAGTNPSIFTQAQWGADGVYSLSNGISGSWNPMTGLGMVNWGSFLQAYNTLVPNVAPGLTLTAGTQTVVGQPDTVTAYVHGLVNPLYQFQITNPKTGATIPSGPFSPNTSFTFTPSVPGPYHVTVSVEHTGGSTLVSHTTVYATTTQPMVSGLTVSSSLGARDLRSGASVTITGAALDTGSHPEYQFVLRNPQGASRIVQRWSSVRTMMLSRLKPGSYAVIVYALDKEQILHHHWAQAYRRTAIINVDSRLSITTPSSASVGTLVTVQAQTANLTQPLFQMMVVWPNGQRTWSGAYRRSSSLTFIPTQPGSYSVEVFAKDLMAPPGSAFSLTRKATIQVTG